MAFYSAFTRYNIARTNEHFLHEVINLFDNVLHGKFHGHNVGVRGVRNRGGNDDYYITLFGVNEQELSTIISMCNYGNYEIDEYRLRKTIDLEPFPTENA